MLTRRGELCDGSGGTEDIHINNSYVILGNSMLNVWITLHLLHIMSVITGYVEDNYESLRIFSFKMHKVVYEMT